MKSALELLKDSPALGTLAPEHLRFLAQRTWIRTFEEGEAVFEQGAAAEACYLLVAGKVVMSFRPSEDDGVRG